MADTKNTKNAADAAATPFNDADLAHFKDLIVNKRDKASEDVDRMRSQLADAREQAENDTAYSFHMADAGTDAMEREAVPHDCSRAEVHRVPRSCSGAY